MKSIRTTRLEGKNWRQEMHKFLPQYRSTPHPSTKFSPFQLLFGRSPRTKPPEIPNKADTESAVTTQAKLNDKSAKAKAKQYADHRNKAKEIRDFKIGDRVLVKSEKMGNSQVHNSISTRASYYTGEARIYAYSSLKRQGCCKKFFFL